MYSKVAAMHGDAHAQTVAVHVADIESVLGAAITGAFALEFAVDLLLGLGFLQRHDLAFGEDKALLRHPGFERLEPRLGVRQIMKRGGLSGYSIASASVASLANTFSSMRSQTLNSKAPPGLSTRRASL